MSFAERTICLARPPFSRDWQNQPFHLAFILCIDILINNRRGMELETGIYWNVDFFFLSYDTSSNASVGEIFEKEKENDL